jgi:hypothetical protein
MSGMSLARGLSTINTKKRKPKKLTQKDIQRLETEWRQHNKRMRRQSMHDLQFEHFEDYVAYTRGQYKPKQRKEEKEFKPYAPSQPPIRDTKEYPSLQTSDTIPGACAKRETPKYTGDLITGVAVMHKSNLVPVMRGTKQAEEISRMRR